MKQTRRLITVMVLLIALVSVPAMAACKPLCTPCKPCGQCNLCVKPCGTVKPGASVKPEATAKPGATAKPDADKPQAGSSMSAMASEVVRQTNMDRAKQGMSALTVSSALTQAACTRAAEIVKKFSHTRPNGNSWSTVSSLARGENIAKGQQTADKVMAAWMSSQGHRANILRGSYGSIGVCAYKVNNIMYWVQLFGK